jgi:hypothetical protein
VVTLLLNVTAYSNKGFNEGNSRPTGIMKMKFIDIIVLKKPIRVAARSKTWVCGRSLTGIAGSNPDGGMDVCLL